MWGAWRALALWRCHPAAGHTPASPLPRPPQPSTMHRAIALGALACLGLVLSVQAAGEQAAIRAGVGGRGSGVRCRAATPAAPAPPAELAARRPRWEGIRVTAAPLTPPLPSQPDPRPPLLPAPPAPAVAVPWGVASLVGRADAPIKAAVGDKVTFSWGGGLAYGLYQVSSGESVGRPLALGVGAAHSGPTRPQWPGRPNPSHPPPHRRRVPGQRGGVREDPRPGHQGGEGLWSCSGGVGGLAAPTRRRPRRHI